MAKSQSNPKKKSSLRALLVMIVATVVLIIFLVIALLLVPQSAIPEFAITDQNGDWDAQAQGKIAVFDDKIYPSYEGKYEFIIRNESKATLEYGFRLSEYLNNLNVDNVSPFMMYRLKTENIYLGDGEYHYTGVDYGLITIEPGSEHRMTLEFIWPYEIDDEHDTKDTLLGVAGGKLSVHIFIWASVVEEEVW